MLIKYVGHSCFKIKDDETGYSLMLDPYKSGSVDGYRDIVDIASEVLCSHEHGDHFGTEHVKIEKCDDNPFEVEWIDTYHDPEKGKLRGENRIHIITHKPSGEKLIHYGDIGEVLDDLLTEENLAKLKDADVALVPCGGVYTYDRHEALELIERTTPKLVIPMHFRSEQLGFDFPNIDSIEMFADEASKKGMRINASQLCFVNTGDVELGCDVLLLRPQNIS